MSFGGLLRPLTEHGLDVGQVGKMLTYFTFPMTAYSLPVAALFATTMVYGRLSADNEVVAARSAGISHLAMALPALVLGLTVALISLLMLCFIVPAFMLKAEKVLFSNVAQIVASSIERSHQLKLFEQGNNSVTVFGQGARVQPPDPKRPNEQSVVLSLPMIVTYEPQTRQQREQDAPRVPKDFFLAHKATAFIVQNDQVDELTFTTVLEDGVKFPRRATGGQQGGLDSSLFTARYPSLVRENTKFMDLWRLKELLHDDSKARRVRTLMVNFVAAEQSQMFLQQIRDSLTTETAEHRLDTTSDGTWIISRGKAVAALKPSSNELVIGAPPNALAAATPNGAASALPPIQREVRVRQEQNGQTIRSIDAQQLRVIAQPMPEDGVFAVALEFDDAIVRQGGGESVRQRYSRNFTAAMPAAVAKLPEIRKPADYAGTFHNVLPDQQKLLKRARLIINNTVRSELHARVSFALSCLILVMVGCALGLMFRSGNFLTAFAVSVVPALISIALIITGQHTCDSVPWDVTKFQNTLSLGLSLIWSGNIAVAAIAITLLARLHRQ
jgi:lipopolysaccharide export LptBFGC system permease protein LptF